jgi:hypothetical protein
MLENIELCPEWIALGTMGATLAQGGVIAKDSGDSQYDSREP